MAPTHRSNPRRCRDSQVQGRIKDAGGGSWGNEIIIRCLHPFTPCHCLQTLTFQPHDLPFGLELCKKTLRRSRYSLCELLKWSALNRDGRHRNGRHADDRCRHNTSKKRGVQLSHSLCLAIFVKDKRHQFRIRMFRIREGHGSFRSPADDRMEAHWVGANQGAGITHREEHHKTRLIAHRHESCRPPEPCSLSYCCLCVDDAAHATMRICAHQRWHVSSWLDCGRNVQTGGDVDARAITSCLRAGVPRPAAGT